MKRHLLILSLMVLIGCLRDNAEEQQSEQDEVAETAISSPLEERTHLVIAPSFRKVEAGDTLQLTPLLVSGVDQVVAQPPDQLLWTSSDPEVASVDPSGLVTTVSSGRVTITGSYQGQSASAYLTIQDPPPISRRLGGVRSTESPIDGASPTGGPTEMMEGGCGRPPPAVDPFADSVVSYTIGENGGFHEELLPEIVLGPPRAHPGAPRVASYDVFSLGVAGEMVLEFTDFILCDGEGSDLIVFENAFQVGNNPDVTFAEPGIVGVSEDGSQFVEFPCDLEPPYTGCAGVEPVLANPDINNIDPTDPAEAGGDPFDLAALGVTRVRFIRIRDSGLRIGPIGPRTAGFDLDAVAVVNGIPRRVKDPD